MFIFKIHIVAFQCDWRNSWLAEPFEVQLVTPARDAIRTKMLPENVASARIVPAWASVLYATAAAAPAGPAPPPPPPRRSSGWLDGAWDDRVGNLW